MTRTGAVVCAALLVVCQSCATEGPERSAEPAAALQRSGGDQGSGVAADDAPDVPWSRERAEAEWAEAIDALGRGGGANGSTAAALAAIERQIGAVTRARVAALSLLHELQQEIAAREALEGQGGEASEQLRELWGRGRGAREDLRSIFEFAVEMKSALVLLRLRAGGVAAERLDQMIFGLDAEQAHHVVPEVTWRDGSAVVDAGV